MLRYGLERPVIIQIDVIGMVSYDKVGFYIRDSQEIDRRHVPRISEAIRGSGGIE